MSSRTTRSQARNEPVPGPSRLVASDLRHLFETEDSQDEAFRSFTNRAQPNTSTPAGRHRERADSSEDEDDSQSTVPPRRSPPAPPPPPPVPVDDPRREDDDSDGSDPPDGNGNGGADAPADPLERILFGLTRAVTELARSNTAACQPQPIPDPPRRTKVREPDQFDGSDPRKLRTFFVQCELNFQDRPRAFPNDSAKVIFATSYLKGAALDWFEPDLLRGPHTRRPPWMDDFIEFSTELARNFGPHDPEGDAEHQLANLTMKDGQRINKYIVEFNRHASQVRGYGEGALRRHFYQGLPDRVKDEISRVGKPASLYDLRDLAQSIDARYWERKSEISREAKHTPSSSKPFEKPAEKHSFSKSARASTPAPASSSGGKVSKDRESGDKPATKSDFASKIGKDGKLTREERQRRFDNNLCMVCGKPGHMARECNKSSRAKARAAKAIEPEADPESSDEEKN
jgi:hypothetical protein